MISDRAGQFAGEEQGRSHMQRRAVERIPVNLEAMLFWDDTFHPGTVINLSEKGMFINTENYPPDNPVPEITILLSHEVLKVTSYVIKRTARTDSFNASPGNSGIGIELFNPPPQYLQFVEWLKIVF